MKHLLGLGLLCLSLNVVAQEPTLPVPAPPPGKVIFERQEKPPVATEPAVDPNATTQPPATTGDVSSSLPSDQQRPEPPDADVKASDDEREALTFTAYDLDLHLVPATSSIEAHVNFTVRNDGKVALKQLALQISSSLIWESLRPHTGPAGAFVQHRINTDADHTGVAREAVITLPQPLAPGASLDLTAIYTGSIAISAERLERIGAPADQAAKADWDTISPESTALRGYGNVLWYPISSAPVFLGDGAKLFDSVGHARQRQQAATVRLRLTVQYTGDAPDAVFFCGRREPFTVFSDNDSVPVASGQGVATAEFGVHLLGFRIPSLFLTDRAATTSDGALIRAVTDNSAALDQYAAAAAKTQPLLMDWLGDRPLGPLDILDHAGQPFEDDAFLVTPLHAGELTTLTPVLVHTLAHSWFASSHAWLDEGVAQFMSLLWVETNDGRQVGLARLQSSDSALALAEPDLSAKPSVGAVETPRGQSLIDASNEVYYRTKAAAVLWMLRAITGDAALKQALQRYRHNRSADATPQGFERTLEEASHKDLKWFFDDWVYNDRGLPDLTIENISTRPAPARGGKSDGFLVAINVRNDGDAAADVPVTVRSGTLTATERLRIAGHANAATRILFQDTPEEVIVNDGTVPEMRESSHVKKVLVKAE